MADASSAGASQKAIVFFERAEQVAGTGNWDFAIELYLEGIRRDPGNTERGHQPLREVSLKRKIQGGKSAGMLEAFKRRGGKTALETLINSEYLASKDPGSSTHMLAVVKAAQQLDNPELVDWAAKTLLGIQKQGKANKAILASLAEAFEQIEAYPSAIEACRLAIQLSPNDNKIQDQLKDLSAKDTIKRGKYGEEGDVTRSVRDMAKQKELFQKDAMVKSDDYLKQQVERTRKEYQESPQAAGKINALVDALIKTANDADLTEAIEVLTQAHKESGSYAFKMRIGEVKIRQMTNVYRALLAAGDKQAAIAQAKKLLDFELAEYAERTENYPTDLGLKFELGKRQFLSGKLDEAIGTLQKAQRDARRHIASLNYLGQAFARKGLNQEAAETYERALESDVPEGQKKEMVYHLAEIYEKMEQFQKAEDLFSDLAQMDFTFRDVSKRLEVVRQKRSAQTPGDQPGPE